MSSKIVYDLRGKVIGVGFRVKVVDSDRPQDVGVVKQITDMDGDADESGRERMIPPYVYVDFVDGIDDRFPCAPISGTGSSYEEPDWEVEEIEPL